MRLSTSGTKGVFSASASTPVLPAGPSTRAATRCQPLTSSPPASASRAMACISAALR